VTYPNNIQESKERVKKLRTDAKALRLSQPALFGVIKKSELSLSPDTSTWIASTLQTQI